MLQLGYASGRTTGGWWGGFDKSGEASQVPLYQWVQVKAFPLHGR